MLCVGLGLSISTALAAPLGQTTVWEGTLTPTFEGGKPATITFTVTNDTDGNPIAIDYALTVAHLVLNDDGAQCGAGNEATYNGSHETIQPWTPAGEPGHLWFATEHFDSNHPSALSITGLLGRTLDGLYVGPNHSEGTVQLFYEIDAGDGDTVTLRCIWTWEISAGAGGVLAFSNANYRVNEYDGSATITVVRTGTEQGEITVDYATQDETATGGQDYSATAGTLIFATGETQKSFTIPILPDSVTEGEEHVTLSLTNATNGAILGAPSTAVLTIDDRPDLYVAPYPLNELALVQSGNRFILKNVAVRIARLANEGEAVVNGITAEVTSNGTTIHQEPAFSLTPSGDKVLLFDWDVTDQLAAAGGRATLNLLVKVDPANTIPERDESNNLWQGGRTIDVRPVIETVTPQYTLQGRFFLRGIPLDNKIEVIVSDWNGEASGTGLAPYGTVHFDLNGDETAKPATATGADHTYDMGTDFALANACNKNVLQVWAVAATNSDIASDRMTSQTTAVNLPEWVAWVKANLQTYDANFTTQAQAANVNYRYGFRYPDPAFEALWDVPGYVPIFAGEPLGISSTVAEIVTNSSSTGTGDVVATGQTGFTSAPLTVGAEITGDGITAFRCKDGLPVLDFDEATLGFLLSHERLTEEITLRDLLPGVANSLSAIPFIGDDIATLIDANHVGVSFTPSGGLQSTFTDQGAGELEFNNAGGTVRLDVGAAATVALLENLQLTVTGGGQPYVQLRVPKPPGYLERIGLNVAFEAILQLWSFEYDLGTGINCGYPDGCGLDSAIVAASAPNAGGWQPIVDQSDLATDTSTLAATNPAGSNGDTILLTNSYAYAAPALAIANDGIRLLAYVDHDQSAPTGRGTEIHVRHWDGTAWQSPHHVTNDAQPDYNPVIVFDQNHHGVMLWERSTVPPTITPSLDVTFTRSLEIVAAHWDGTTWSAPVQLSTNGLMDSAPKLVRSRDGTVMALWQRGDGTSLVGTAAAPLSLIYSIWDGTTWQPPATALTNQQGVLWTALAANSATEAALLVAKAVPDQGTTGVELFYSTFDGVNWRPLQQLTDNAMMDHVPTLAYDSSGSRHLVWRQGDQLLWLRDSWDATQAEVILPISTAGMQGEFVLVEGDGGELALVGQATDGLANGTTYLLYDPDTEQWSTPQQLASSGMVEREHATAIDSDGSLHIAKLQTAVTYVTGTVTISSTQVNVTNLPQLSDIQSASQLAYHVHLPHRDLRVSQLTLAPPNPAPGQPVTITALVENIGDLAAATPQLDIVIGTAAPTTHALPDLAGGATELVTMQTTMPSSALPLEIRATVDPGQAIVESNEANNSASHMALLPDLWLADATLRYDSQGISITVTVVNRGVTVLPAGVDLWVGDADVMRESALAASLLPALAPNATTVVTLAIPTQQLTQNSTTLWIVGDGDERTVEADEANNRVAVSVPILPDVTLAAADIVGGANAITVTVHNRGLAQATGVTLWVGPGTTPPTAETALHTTMLPALAAGQSMALTVATPPGDGFYAVELDPLGVLAEGNEGNNLAISRVLVTEPDAPSTEIYLPVITR